MSDVVCRGPSGSTETLDQQVAAEGSLAFDGSERLVMTSQDRKNLLRLESGQTTTLIEDKEPLAVQGGGNTVQGTITLSGGNVSLVDRNWERDKLGRQPALGDAGRRQGD